MDSLPNHPLLPDHEFAVADFRAVRITWLAHADPACLDELPYGVIGFDRDGHVTRYNRTEATGAGLQAARIIGRPFFLAVAPCMNNYLVAHRFEEEPDLDAELDYVLTFRMRPTPVRLRLLQASEVPLRFVLIKR
jgi:photoactive yellow protein